MKSISSKQKEAVSRPWFAPTTGSGNKERLGTTLPILVGLEVKEPSARAVFESVFQQCTNFRIHDALDHSAPDITILEVGPDPHRALALIRSLPSNRRSGDIFLTGAPPDSTVLLEALRAGVKEFFPYPVNVQHVQLALERYAEAMHSSENGDSSGTGKIISVMGSRGGLGTTSLAVNLAVSLKMREPDKSVVLVEIDQQSGNLPLYLDLSPSYSLRDFTNDLHRLDDALIKKFLIDHESGIQVLPSGYDNLHAGNLDSSAVHPTLTLLASLFDYIVVDVGHIFDASLREALSLSDLIMLVTTLQVPAIHRTQTLLQAFQKDECKGRVEIVVSQYRDEELGLIEETESTLEHRVGWRIPEDPIHTRQAINQGAPCVMLSPKTSIAKSYAELARWVSNKAGEPTGSQEFYGHFHKLIQYGRAKLRLAPAS